MTPYPYKRRIRKKVSKMKFKIPDESVNLLHHGVSTKFSRQRGFHIWK